MSKGSSPRPFEIERGEYEKRWDAIFGKKIETCPCCGSTNTSRLSGPDFACNECDDCDYEWDIE